MKIKTCQKCRSEKKLSKFNKEKNRKDGISFWCRDCSKRYYQSRKEELKKYQNKYYHSHKKERKKYNENHKKEIKEYNQSRKNKMKKYHKEYAQSCKIKRNKENKRRRKTDINYKILGNLRSRLYCALKKNKKSLSTMFLIGCSVEYLMYYLQCKFTKGMNWDNYGRGWDDKKEWHIDHIKPCSSFDLSKHKEQLKCFNYKNL